MSAARTTTIQPGDVVEITRDLDYFDRGHKGTRFTADQVEDGFRPGDPEYGDPDWLQGPIVHGWANHSTAEVQASDLRLVSRAADVKEPTPDRVARALRIDSMSDEPWFCHQQSYEGGGVTVF